MKSKILVYLSIMVFAGVTSAASAAVTINFNQTECPACVNLSPVAGNEWNAFGLTVDNAYWYIDSRDAFDTMGLSIDQSPAVISLATASNGLTFDYWVISGYTGTYEAFDSTHTLLGSFFVDASSGNALGTHSFNGSVASLEWAGSPGFVQVSTLTISPVPESETYAMLLAGLGLLGFAARRRQQNV